MKLFRCTLLLSSLLLWVACSNSDNGEVPPAKDEIKFENTDDQNLVVDDSDTEHNVWFEASKPWKTEISTTGHGWLSVYPASGDAGKQSVKITMQPNETYESRTAEIAFSTQATSRADVEGYVIKVTQAQKDALVIAEKSYIIAENGGEIKIKLGHNVDFDVQIGCDWIKQRNSRAFVNEELVFTVAPNEGYDNREATIAFISTKDQGLHQEVTVYQAQKDALTVTPTERKFDSKEHTFDIVVKSNVDYQVKDPSVSWLHRIETRALSERTISYRVDANTDVEPREAKITIEDASTGLKEQVSITQMQQDALVVADRAYQLTDKGGEIKVKVSHNVEYEYSISDSWVEFVEPTRAMYVTDELKFNVKANESYDDRQCEITFTQKGNFSDPSAGGLSQTIIVKQSQKDGLIIEPKELKLGNDDVEAEFVVKTNVEFEVHDPKVDWLHRRRTPTARGLVDHKIVYDVDANVGVEPRETEVVVLNTATKEQQTVKIYQAQKDAMVISPEMIEIGREAQNVEIKVGHNVEFNVEIPAECDWLKQIDKTRIYQEDVVEFSATENTSTNAREVIVEFTSPSNRVMSQEVTIVQAGKEEKLEVKVEELFMPDLGTITTDPAGNTLVDFTSVKQYFEVIVTADNKYTLEIERDELAWENLPPYTEKDPAYQWFSHAGKSADEKLPNTFIEQFYMDYNGGNGESYIPVERHVTLRFVSESGKITRLVKVKQQPATIIQIDPSTQARATAEGGIVEIPFRNNSATPEDYTVEVIDADWLHWVQPIKSRAEMTQVKFQIKVDPNPSVFRRSAQIFITMKGESAAQSVITMTQDGKKDIYLMDDSLTFNHTATEFDFLVYSSDDKYTIESPAVDWLHLTNEGTATYDEERGVYVRRVYYSVDANTTSDNRQAQVRLNHPTYPKTLTIIQQVNGKVIVEGDTRFNNISRLGTQLRIPIQRNITYEVFTTSDWIEWVKPTRGMVNDTVVINIKPNKSPSSRRGEFSVMPIDNDGTKYTTFTVYQLPGLDAEEQAIWNVLEQIYTQTDGKNWKYQDNWLTDAPFDKWLGVYTRQDGSGKTLLMVSFKNTMGMKGQLHLTGAENLYSLTIMEPECQLSNITLEDCPALTQLEIYGQNPPKDVMPLSSLKVNNCPLLNSISVTNSSLGNDIVLEGLPLLTTLRLNNNLITNTDFLKPTFASLQYLYMEKSKLLTNIDLSTAPKIINVFLNESPQLATVNVTGATTLSSLSINNCPVTDLDLSTNTVLNSLECVGTHMKSLDITKTKLNKISINEMPYIEKLIANEAAQLNGIYVNNVKLPKLVIEAKNAGNLRKLIVGSRLSQDKELDQYINDLQIDVAGCSQLAELMLASYSGQAHELIWNMFDSYKLTKINTTGCNSVRYLYFNGTPAGWDLGQFSTITNFAASNYKVQEMDLSKNKELAYVTLRNTTLEHVALKDMPKLFFINADRSHSSSQTVNNSIGFLDIENCPKLQRINISNNPRVDHIRVANCPDLGNGYGNYNSVSFDSCKVKELELVGQMTFIKSFGVSGSLLSTVDCSTLPNLESLYIANSTISSINIDSCPNFSSLHARDSHMNQEFTKEFYQYCKHPDLYTPKYTYKHYTDSEGNAQVKVTSTTYGFWFPGEPASKEHRAPAGW